jgi:pimeloyl-ACP methyl ester carboxylesterase
VTASFTAADGTRLAYEDAGQGTPILCLAGLTRNMRDFDHVAPHLAGHRMIRMDYRGRGLSDHADPATYTIPQEAADAVALLDHLGVAQAAILGTSRGGLIALVLAATARDRLAGIALNDIGPDIAPRGLDIIEGYLGRRPAQKTWAEAAAARASAWTGFRDVPPDRWLAEVRAHYDERPDGLYLRYDPRLRGTFLAARTQPAVDLWPLFDATAGLPLLALRGANSDILTRPTFARMKRHRPEMIAATVPGRGHVPFLDEPASLAALRQWLELLP